MGETISLKIDIGHLMLSRNWCKADAVMVACDTGNLVTPLLDADDAKLDTLFKLVNWRLPRVALLSLPVRSRTPAVLSKDVTCHQIMPVNNPFISNNNY